MTGICRKNLKKESFVVWIARLVFLVLAVSVLCWNLDTAAYANDRKVADNSGLLTSKEESRLQERLTEISERYQCDVIAATTDSFDGQGRWDYTDEFYNENGYGYGDTIDGIILMVNLPEREFQYLTRGKATEIFTDYGLEMIDEQVTPYLSDGEYFDAFMKYADLAEDFLQEAMSGKPYDVNHVYKQRMSAPVRIAIAAGVGLVVAVIVLLILFGQLRTVRAKGQAHDYVRKGSFRVTGARDLFLYHTITRHRIEHNDKGPGGGPRHAGGGSSTRPSSGGGRSGGRGGSF